MLLLLLSLVSATVLSNYTIVLVGGFDGYSYSNLIYQFIPGCNEGASSSDYLLYPCILCPRGTFTLTLGMLNVW